MSDDQAAPPRRTVLYDGGNPWTVEIIVAGHVNPDMLDTIDSYVARQRRRIAKEPVAADGVAAEIVAAHREGRG
jgi:hypothetical protein